MLSSAGSCESAVVRELGRPSARSLKAPPFGTRDRLLRKAVRAEDFGSLRSAGLDFCWQSSEGSVTMALGGYPSRGLARLGALCRGARLPPRGTRSPGSRLG